MEKQMPLAVLLLLASLVLPFPPSTAISDEELEAAIYALRSRGYHLFGNSIISSDVRFDLLFSNTSFTLFAPTDAALFSLDMVFSASAYVNVLRHHVALGLHPFPALRALIPGTSIPTLLPSRKIVISYRDPVGPIIADGVDVVRPGILYGQNLAVHGLAGILTQHTMPPSETPATPLLSPDSLNSPANSPDVSGSQPSGQAVPKELRKPNGAPVAVLTPMAPHSHAPASGFSYPPMLPPIPTTATGSPVISPSMSQAGCSCSSTAAPPAFSLCHRTQV